MIHLVDVLPSALHFIHLTASKQGLRKYPFRVYTLQDSNALNRTHSFLFPYYMLVFVSVKWKWKRKKRESKEKKLYIPPGEEQGQSNCLKDTGHSTNCNGVQRSLLCEDLGDELFLVSKQNPGMSKGIVPREQSWP